MPDLGPAAFATWFDFGRPVTGAYLNATGGAATAAANVPRFDHNIGGKALGLLVEVGTVLGQGDYPQLKAGALDDLAGAEVTILHARTLGDGTVERRAWYTRAARRTINALMVRAGRHASIGVVPGFLVNKAGHVRYRQQNWMLTGVISDGAGHVLADDQGNLIIEG